MPKKQISILGCGWLGFPLGKALLALGHDVKGSTTREEKLPVLEAAGIRPHIIKLEETLSGTAVEDFFNSEILILNIPPGRRNPNVEYLFPLRVKSVLAAARKGAVEQIIFASSTGVYGNCNQVVKESDEVAPSTPSGRALVKAEQLLLDAVVPDVTILRLAGLVGGDRKAGRFLAGKKNISGGNAAVNMVHQEDCIAVICEIITADIRNQIFNVCADEHPTRKDFYTTQARRQGFELPLFSDTENRDYKIVSNEKLKSILNYEFVWPDPMLFK